MTISEKTGDGQSVTEYSRALKLFTNRHDIIRHFVELVNDDLSSERSVPEKILFLHGDGGNGKSLLISYLHARCCKRFSNENWDYIKEFRGQEFVSNIIDAEGAKEIPASLIDFGRGPALDVGSLQDGPTALLSLRKDLSLLGFRFPLFDFACIWHLHKGRGLSGDQIKKLFPVQDLMAEVINAFTHTNFASIVKAAISLTGNKWDSLYTVFRSKRKLTPDQFAAIDKMDVKTELLDNLPKFFAEDLNAAIKAKDAPERVVLFFDTHEAFWGVTERNISNDRFFYRDEWLRVLFSSLDLSAGILTVVAGREPPKWPEAARFSIPEQYLSVWTVGHLTNQDAISYLERAGVQDEVLRQALVEYASVATNEVHPFYLGLCVDIVETANGRGARIGPEDFKETEQLKKKEQQLLERLLRYVDADVGYSVRALSACRAFNLDIYLRLGQDLKFQADLPSFELLTGFSFVWKSRKSDEGWYRIHDLVRRLGRENEDSLVTRGDTMLEAYYRELNDQGDKFAIAEAIYHASNLDWERGINEWKEIFDKAFIQSRYSFCAELLEIKQEMSINSDFQTGRVSYSEGQYFFGLSRYENARQEYLRAIKAFDQVLKLPVDNLSAHNHRAASLASLGDVQTVTSQYQHAVISYQAAIDSYVNALLLAPEDAATYNNKGVSLRSLGDLQKTMSLYESAIDTYQTAIADFDKCLSLEPENVDAHNNKGNALQRLGDLQVMRSQYGIAMTTYQAAVEAHSKCLSLAPESVRIYSNKGVALQKQGDVQAAMSDHQAAMATYTNAIDTFDKCLLLAPDDIGVHNNKGNALARLGDAQTAASHHHAALTSYHAAIAAFDQSLLLAPDLIEAHNNKGNGLQRLGDLQTDISQDQMAIISYEAAIAAYDRALSLAPNYVSAHNNKGNVLQRLGDLRAAMFQHRAAMTTYQSAIDSYRKGLSIAPDDISVYNNMGRALEMLADTQIAMSDTEGGLASYRAAIDAFEKCLSMAPDDIDAHNNKGHALAMLGNHQRAMSHFDEAKESWLAALVEAELVLRIASDDATAQHLKDALQKTLSDLR